MKCIALELSSARGSIAWSNETEPGFVEFANDRKHSGLFFEQLQRSLRELPNPDKIVVGLGPGSYAGTRIAIAAAIGLQAATGAVLVGIASGRAIAVGAPEYVIVGDARRQSFHFARVQHRQLFEGPLLCSEDELRERIATANVPAFASETLPAFPDVTIAYPSALLLHQIAETEPLPQTDAPVEPIYLREPHITQANHRSAIATV